MTAYSIRRQWLPCEIEARYSNRTQGDLRAAIAVGCERRGNQWTVGGER